MVRRPDSRLTLASPRPAPRSAASRKKRGVPHRASAVLDRPPLTGWRTSDEDEIALRRWRGITEIVAIEPLEPNEPVFGTFRAHSGSGGCYAV